MNKIRVSVFLFFMLLPFVSNAEEYPIISTSEMKTLIESEETFFLLNPLSDIEFNEQHIKKSVNIPLNTIQSTTRLPEDKATLIITYCLGPR
jgi:rhodanese-related sulfurtransferase